MSVTAWVSAGYFAYMFVAAVVRPPWPRRRRAALLSAGLALAVVAVEQWPDSGTWSVRSVVPLVWLLAGYGLSGLYFVQPMLGIEARCLAMDWRVFDALGVNAFLERAPRAVLELVELFYFLCYLFLPAGLAVVMAAAPALTDWSWALVLLAEFGAFGMLPWIQTRPPRAIEPMGPLDRRTVWMRGVNRQTGGRLSIVVNTLPSGHVSGSIATAMAVGAAAPVLGPPAFAVAIAISIAAVLGRYHYAIDAVTGAAVAGAAWALIGGVGG